MSCAILWGSLLANERTSETRRTNPTRASIIPGRAQDHYTRASTRPLYQGEHKTTIPGRPQEHYTRATTRDRPYYGRTGLGSGFAEPNQGEHYTRASTRHRP